MYNNLFFCFPCYMQQFTFPFPDEQMRSIEDFEYYNDAEDYNDETENYSNMEDKKIDYYTLGTSSYYCSCLNSHQLYFMTKNKTCYTLIS